MAPWPRLLALAISLVAVSAHGVPLAAQAGASPYGVRETWTSPDKLQHFAVSALIAGTVYSGARKLGLRRVPAVAVGVGMAGVAGLYREIDDVGRPGKYFSEKDLLWNAAGIAVGIWIPDRLLFPRAAPRAPAAPLHLLVPRIQTRP